MFDTVVTAFIRWVRIFFISFSSFHRKTWRFLKHIEVIWGCFYLVASLGRSWDLNLEDRPARWPSPALCPICEKFGPKFVFKRIWVIRQVSRCFLPLPRFIRIMVSSWCQKLVRLTALWNHMMMIMIMTSQGHEPTCSCTAHAREASSSYICRHLIYHHQHHDQWPRCSGCQKLVRLVAPQHKRMYYKRQCWVQLTIVSAWRIFANGKEYFACPNCQLARGWGFHMS